jgi:hypothetical protein
MAKYRISEILCNIFFQAAVSALFWQPQFCTSKKNFGIDCVNIQKFLISSSIKELFF